MTTLRRALLLGLAFGLAASTAELWLNLIPFTQRRFGPGPLFFVKVAALQLLLGALLGALAAPLLRLRGGPALHVLAVSLLWYGLERWVSVDAPLFTPLEVGPPAAGAVLVLLGLLVARWRPAVAWMLGLVALAAGMAAPQIYLRATAPPRAVQLEPAPPPPGAPDVVLIVLDTVRAGSLSTYGYERPTAAGIDALAREGALFLDATSPSTWSLPSHASLFTGRYPSSHGAHAEHRYLDARFPTLAEVLERSGYETYCFTSNAWISDGLGLTRGFGWQDESLRSQGGAGIGFSFIHRLLDRVGLQDTDKGGGIVADAFAAWAAERPAETDRPAFVFLNFIEAHFPYHQLPQEHLFRFTDRPYGELREISMDLLGAQFGGAGRRVEEVEEPTRAMYDGGVVYSDELLSRIVGALRTRGTLDDTVLVVLADHGEVLGERAGFFGHGPSLYQESIGVPLLIRYPPRVPAGVRVSEPVSTLGVFATILELAELSSPPTLQVGSLIPLLSGGGSEAAGPILSELHDATEMSGGVRDRPDPQMLGERRYRMLREGSLKLVETSKGEALLYDLEADPGETRDLAPERPEVLAQMRARMAEVQARLELPDLDAPLAVGEDAPELDEATRQQLRALGYAD
ncbi:MAG: sulfatase-like hydrolase/transferase [Myxococcota bacterium]